MGEDKTTIGGKILARAIIEVMGKPKEHVEKILGAVVQKAREYRDIEVKNVDKADAEQQKDAELWSAFAELEILVNGIPRLFGFCLDFMPSSIEILEPDSFSIQAKDFSDLTVDLLERLNNLTILSQKLRGESTFLKKNFGILIRNTIFSFLKNKELAADELAKLTGIDKKEIESFLADLIKEKKVEEKDGIYRIK